MIRRPTTTTLLVPALFALTAATGLPAHPAGDEAPADVVGAREAAAQQPERAAYLTLLGEDTLAIEWMEFDGHTVQANALIRGTRTMFGDYRLEFDDRGEVVAYRARTWAGTDSTGELLGAQRVMRTDEGAVMVTMRGGEESRSELDAPPGAVPFIDMLHWPFEASMRWNLAEKGGLPDGVPIFGGRRAMTFDITANDDGTWELHHPSRGPSTMEVDDEGRIVWLDGTGSTRAYDLRRVPWSEVPPDVMASRFEDRPLGELSGRGQIDDVVAGVHFTGHYGEPLKRGRDIFGGLLAYGEWWRTGANAATHLSFDEDIVIDGEIVPAGDYTLSSIPEEDGGTLIINRQTGQGGQSYDESMDQARVRMRRDMLDRTVEAFEIRAVETDEGGRLELRWDDTVYWVPFTVAGG